MVGQTLRPKHSQHLRVQHLKRSITMSNPNYPSKSGNPSGGGRGNTPKSK